MRDKVRDIGSAKIAKTSNAPPRGITPRRLAAIIAGDIAGYSRLMELDEEGTHARFKRLQRDLIEPSIMEHYGRLVKTTGDGFIAIFDSPVEAVRCAIVIQQNMSGRNTSHPKDLWIEYRLGVNLGDVIIEEDDIYGDGVNIASRLESMAAPGQVYISGGIYEQIKNKLVCGYESLGDRKVKNITDPVRVYRVLPDPTAFKTRKHGETGLILLISLVWFGIASVALWYWLPYGRLHDTASVQPSPQAPQVPSPPPVTKQSTPPSQPSPAAAAAAQPARPQIQPVPSVAPTEKRAALQDGPAMQPVPAVREPETNMLRGGTFLMGSNEDASEKPVHHVTIRPFAISRYPISVREWNQCAAAKACPFVATGKDEAPVTNVSWSDAKQFVAWLAGVTRKQYRLPTEAEWEYAARGGMLTRYWWGDELQPGMANCKNCSDVAAAEQPSKIGSFKPNPFGLYDMGGGVDQWVEDCWHKNYQGAPSDGSPWLESECGLHVMRSGSWKNDARYVRPANRDSYDTNVRYPTHGFRIALSP
jgi:formylglycine-generating enzyme required for sulfatase activity/class 3 adenylate cyclase